MELEKGICLIAGGHPYYGKMAAVLAASLRYTDKNIPIILFTAGDVLNHLKPAERNLFTEIKTLPRDTYMHNDVHKYIRAKTFLYDLSPFDETLFLDVDMIWHHKKPVAQLFESLKDINFTMINEGSIDFATGANSLNPNYTHWLSIAELKAAYKNRKSVSTGKLYQLRSELIYFKKSKANERYFHLAQQLYDNPKVKIFKMGFAETDESAFNVASLLLGHYPHRDKYCPVYWQYIHQKFMLRKDIQSKFFATSIGGNKSFPMQKEIYSDLSRFYYKELGLINPYRMREKRDYLPERIKI